MKKYILWFIAALSLSVILSACMLGGGFQIPTSPTSISGNIYGVSLNSTITITDDLGEKTTVTDYWNDCYSYEFDVKPGVRTLTFECAGYTTISTKVSAIGNMVTLNVTMEKIGK